MGGHQTIEKMRENTPESASTIAGKDEMDAEMAGGGGGARD